MLFGSSCRQKLSLDNAAFPFLAYSGIPAVSFCFCEVSLKNATALYLRSSLVSFETKFPRMLSMC